MIDTNTIAQAASVAAQLMGSTESRPTLDQINWPAIAAAALWVRADVFKAAEWIIGHGGVGMILKKLLCNPPPVEQQLRPTTDNQIQKP